MTQNTLEQATAEILAATLKTAGEAKDFVLAELPDVVQQLLVWKAAYNFVWFAVWIGAAWGCYLAYRRLDVWIHTPIALTTQQQERLETLRNLGYSRRTSSEDSEFSSLGTAPIGYWGVQYIALALAGLFLVTAFSSCLVWLQILVAPKVYLIEYTAQLVGK